MNSTLVTSKSPERDRNSPLMTDFTLVTAKSPSRDGNSPEITNVTLVTARNGNMKEIHLDSQMSRSSRQEMDM